MAERNLAFDKAMFEIYRRAKGETSYNATIFLQMLTDTDGLTTAKMLINAPRELDGYTALDLRAGWI